MTDALALQDVLGGYDAGPVTVYVAAKITTMNPAMPHVEAVAVAGDQIIAVGSLAAVKAELGAQPYVIDEIFANKFIMPGFVEQHIHPLLGAASMAADAVIAIEDWELPEKTWRAARDATEYNAMLSAAFADSPESAETFISWGFHQMFHGPLDRAALDQLSTARPIIVWHRSCHEFFLNTAALAKYEITAESVQGHGLASTQVDFFKGHFYEKGLELVVPFILKDVFTPKRLQKGLQIFKQYVHSKGITTICEPGTQLSRPLHNLFAAELGTPDVAFRTYFIPDGRLLYEQAKKAGTFDALAAQSQTYLAWGHGKMQWLPKQIKFWADGAIFSQLMQMQKPYLDGHQGEWIMEPQDYQAAFKIFWNAGYQIHTHVNGDQGLEVVTATLEENMATNPRQDHRFTVVHFAVSTDEQVRRLVKHGAQISANPYYVTSLADCYSEVGLGPELADSMVRLGTVEANNAYISLHSDMPMAPADPLLLAWAAESRTTFSGRSADPSQRISRQQALRAITIESARAISLETEIGSIMPGKKADFTILESDPESVDVVDLKTITIWGTLFAGTLRPIEASSAAFVTSHTLWQAAFADGASIFCGCCKPGQRSSFRCDEVGTDEPVTDWRLAGYAKAA